MSLRRAGIIAAGWGERLQQSVPKALTPVGGRALIDYTLDGLEAAGIEAVTCIVNESATAVVSHVKAQNRRLDMDWIVRTTPSSMHSFLLVLERLARWNDSQYLLTTVDSVCPSAVFQSFVQTCALFKEADVCLGLTSHIDDEKPLRVAMAGSEGTGIMPAQVADDPEAYSIVALTNTGFESEYVTAGFYAVRPSILREASVARDNGFTALRQYLGHLLKYGYRFYGAPLPPIIDVDRAQDVQAAEKLLGIS